MTWVVAPEMNKAALDAMLALLNSGQIRLDNASSSELATVGFGATAFAAASTASPAVALSNPTVADTLVVAGTIAFIDFRTSGGSSRLRGTVGLSGSGADFITSDNEIPSGTDSVNVAGQISISLQIQGAS
jgi:hypothetical protein